MGEKLPFQFAGNEESAVSPGSQQQNSSAESLLWREQNDLCTSSEFLQSLDHTSGPLYHLDKFTQQGQISALSSYVDPFKMCSLSKEIRQRW